MAFLPLVFLPSAFLPLPFLLSGNLGVLSSLKKSKNPRKTRINQTPPTHPLSIFYFILETSGNMKTTQKNTIKHNISKKNYNPSRGLTHPPTSEFFSDFWIFFNLTKPLTTGIFTFWHFYKWHFYQWHFYQWHFYRTPSQD